MFSPGDTVDRYEIESLLGRGGMGMVYCARDTKLGRRVALKVVRVDEGGSGVAQEIKARMMREARAVAALDHPGAISIFDVGEVDGTPYIAMELIRGKTLRSIIDDKNADVRRCLRWLRDVASVLSAAHQARLIHRDIKPENVMVRDDGMVKVLDFGIARRQRTPVDASAPTEGPAWSTLTSQGVQVGTPMYMAPEQIRGETLDGRIDQFAWGVMAYELLSGKPPWRADDSLRLVAAILTDPAPPLVGPVPGLSPEVDAVIAKALSKSQDDRFADMDQLIAALDEAVGVGRSATIASGRPGHVRGGGSSLPPMRPRSRPPTATMLTRYSREEMGDILERALLRQQIRDESFSHYELLDAAAEVGVDPTTLQMAARELSIYQVPREARRGQKQRLVRHFAIWCAGGAFFFFIDAFTPGPWWFFYPMLAWGVALAIQLAVYMSPIDAKPRLRRRTPGQRFHSEAELEMGVREVLAYTNARRRIAPMTPPPEPPRMSRSHPTPDLLAAELEAAAESEALIRERR